MKFKPTTWRLSAARSRLKIFQAHGEGKRPVRPGAEAGFTLVEALAALMFLAIVIPVAVQAIQIASRASQVAERKVVAARVADRVLSELIATGQWKQSTANGSAEEGTRQFRWQLRSESWQKDSLRLLTLTVNYSVQGQDYDVHVSTLIDGNPL